MSGPNSSLETIFSKSYLLAAIRVLGYHAGSRVIFIYTHKASYCKCYLQSIQLWEDRGRKNIAHGSSMFSLYDLSRLYLGALFIHFCKYWLTVFDLDKAHII